MAGQVKLMVVGDFPTDADLSAGEMFSSRRDALLLRVMYEACGIQKEATGFDILFDDRTKPEWDKPHADDLKPAQRLELNSLELQARVQQEKPVVVLAIGGMVMEALTGVSAAKLKDNRGKIMDCIADPLIKVVPIYEPWFIEKVKGQLNTYAGDILRAWNYAIGKASGTGKTVVTRVMDMAGVDELLGHINRTKEFCFDFETTGLDHHAEDFKATMLAVSFQHGGAWIVPLEHMDSPFDRSTIHKIMNKFRPILADPSIRKTGHNVKYDIKVLAVAFGIVEIEGRLDDTMLMKHLWDETTPNGLKDVVSNIIPSFAGYDDEVKRYKWDAVPFGILAEYSACDADLTMRLRTYYEDKLLSDPKRYVLYRNLTMALHPVLTAAELNGMLIDRKAMLKNIDRAQELIDAKLAKLLGHNKVKAYWGLERERVAKDRVRMLRSKLEGMKPKKDGSMSKREMDSRAEIQGLKAGTVFPDIGEFNPNSPMQLSGLLYTEEGFNYPEMYDAKKRMNARSTDKDTLNRLDDETGFITDLLTYRSLVKTRGTYLVGILERMDDSDMLHTEFLQHGTKSGRLSSKNPNLQNIPDPNRVKWEEAKEVSAFVKGAFTVPEGQTMVQVDYSQAELRLMAMYAKEEVMLDAYANGIDLHTLTACKLNGLTLEGFKALPADEAKTLRYHAKAGNFGLIYGMSAEGFQSYAQNDYGIEMTLDEAIKIRDTFFKTYPGILNYHDLYIQKARKFEGVRTLFGRFRHIDEIHDPSEYKRGEAERVAVNSPIQGSAAEITMLAIIMLRQRMDPRVKIVNTIHDSIFFYVPDTILKSTVRIIKDTCAHLPTEMYFGRAIKGVTMAVDVEATKENWKRMQAYEG